jgi:hypothetical protein
MDVMPRTVGAATNDFPLKDIADGDPRVDGHSHVMPICALARRAACYLFVAGADARRHGDSCSVCRAGSDRVRAQRPYGPRSHSCSRARFRVH